MVECFDRWYGVVARVLRERVRDVEACVDRGSIDCVSVALYYLEKALENFFPLGECVDDVLCYASRARVGGGPTYRPGDLPVSFLADWWVEFDELPLVDDDLCRWAAAVSLILTDHNQPSNIRLGVSTWGSDGFVRSWRVHIIMKHNEEFDVLGVNVLTALTMWLGEMWGTNDVEVNYLTHGEKTVITFYFESLRDLPEGIRALLSYVGYALDNVPANILVGRLAEVGTG